MSKAGLGCVHATTFERLRGPGAAADALRARQRRRLRTIVRAHGVCAQVERFHRLSFSSSFPGRGARLDSGRSGDPLSGVSRMSGVRGGDLCITVSDLHNRSAHWHARRDLGPLQPVREGHGARSVAVKEAQDVGRRDTGEGNGRHWRRGTVRAVWCPRAGRRRSPSARRFWGRRHWRRLCGSLVAGVVVRVAFG